MSTRSITFVVTQKARCTQFKMHWVVIWFAHCVWSSGEEY